MIDPKSLRIGNFIFHHATGVSSVIGVDLECVEVLNMPQVVFMSDDIDPIPLDAEWLERLGCKPFKNHWGLEGMSIGEGNEMLILSGSDLGCETEDGYAWCQFNTKPIEYVHQFQNVIFALTGTELTVKETA